MKQMDTKKLVLACLVIMILMIVYTKMDQEIPNKETVTETMAAKETGNGPGSLLLTDKLNAEVNGTQIFGADAESGDLSSDENSAEEEKILGPAETLDVWKARTKPYGLVVELDYVSADKISLHGNFGYMVFVLESAEDGTISAVNTNAVTFEELGGLTMGGAAYTDVLAGDGCALIVPGIHNEEIARRRKFLYIEETNEITGGIVAPDWMMKKTADNDYSDAVTDKNYEAELTGKLRNEYGSELLYGPAVILEFDSSTYGFLAADGENLENIWYGLWNRDISTVTKVRLFE